MDEYSRLARHAAVSEKVLERLLVASAHREGWLCVKFANTTSEAGMPDRMVLVPGGRVVWVELKSADGRLSRLQISRHAQLRRHGQVVFTASSRSDIEKIINFVKENTPL